jgi:hypothetical protein
MNSLQVASEWAQAVINKTSLPTSRTCPRYILKQGKVVWNKTRINWHILVKGDDIPQFRQPSITFSFKQGIFPSLFKSEVSRAKK